MTIMQSKNVLSLCGLSMLLLSANGMAATLQTVWDKDDKAIVHFAINNDNPKNVAPTAQLYLGSQASNGGAEQLQLTQALIDAQGNTHARYDQYYRGIPVWGMQAIYHTGKTNAQAPVVTGRLLTDINKDISSLTAKYSAADMLHYAQNLIQAEQGIDLAFKLPQTQLIIYPIEKDHKTVAKLAYTVSFYTKVKGSLTKPFYIIDANTKQVLAKWDEVERQEIGQGPGGNDKQYSLRPALFQYGNADASLPALGKLDITLAGNQCIARNNYVQVINMGKEQIADVGSYFPITIAQEQAPQFQAFAYPCSDASGYVNQNDAGSAPVNGGYSPVNDSLYFATQTYKMLEGLFNIPNPFGTDIPVRIYVHINQTQQGQEPETFDNALAIPAQFSDQGQMISRQQIVIGNGGATTNYPMSQGSLPHEMCHLFTAMHSKLIYANQSGGMNEAFSDMCDLTTRFYISSQFPWYLYDWNIGGEEAKGPKPLRCMDNPTCDGKSIDNAANYKDGMDVHYSSGVYNKAFYLLSTRPGWGIGKTFAAMAGANIYYWIPNSTFDFGCMGVAQAAKNYGYNYQDVINVFSSLGVHCKL